MIGLWGRTIAALLLMLGLTFGPVAAQTPATPPAAEKKAEATAPAEKKDGFVSLEELLKPGPVRENIIGDEKAPITIVEYASLTCPHCATYHTKTHEFVKKVYVDTGKARVIFRDFPFDGVAMAATMLSRCVDPSKFFAITDTLFYRQATWAFGKDPEAELLKIAKEYGFTQETFDACLQNQTMYEGVLEVRKRAFETFKVTSTPTIFVNGEPFRGALTPEQIDTVLKRVLAEKK